MKTSNTPSTAPRTAVAQVHELPNLPFPEIKVLWRKLFGGETPTHNRQFLERNNKKIALLIATGKLRKHDQWDGRPHLGGIVMCQSGGVYQPT